MKNILIAVKILLITSVSVPIFSCNNIDPDNAGKSITKDIAKPKHINKPPSVYPDTLKINFPSAVFYYPDSLQLQKIKAGLDTMVYKGIMHDYFYQMRYAHITIKKNWPQLQDIESSHYRYLLFIKKDSINECIDLNKEPDVYGLIVFDSKNLPEAIDLTNIETQVSFYLKQ